MRLAALATGLLLLALAGHLDRDLMRDDLLAGPGPFEALLPERFDRPDVMLTLQSAIESRTTDARAAVLEGPTGQRISR